MCVCVNVSRKIEIYKSRNKVKVWERKKKKKKDKISLQQLLFGFHFLRNCIIVNQLQNDLSSSQINLQTWHMAFLQIFKKGSIQINPHAIFSFR